MLGFLLAIMILIKAKKWKLLKIILVDIILFGIIIGIFCGLIVTFFFYTPKISLVNASAKIEDDKISFDFEYENKGQSPAINIEYAFRCVAVYKDEIIYKDRGQTEPGIHEVGDIKIYGFLIENEKIGKDILNNSEIIILVKTKYEDNSKCRYSINKLLGNHYGTYRLTFYDVSKQETCLSFKSEKESEFKEMIDIWLEE